VVSKMIEQGTVKWFDTKKGFGFIKRDNGKEDLFVHFSGIKSEGFRNLEADDRVSFEIANGPKGLHAIDVLMA